MKKSVTSNMILFLSSLLLIKLSPLFVVLSLILLLIIFISYIGLLLKIDVRWILGFLLIGHSKKVYSDYGDNFWVLIVKEDNNYYSYLFEDKLFHCKLIGGRSNYNGYIEDLKNITNRKLDKYCGENSERGRDKKVSEAFKKWDGYLTKQDSRDKKISDIC